MRNKFQTQAVKELGSVKGVQALSLEEMKVVNGGGFGPFLSGLGINNEIENMFV